jgi:hypothetical protein
VGEGDETGHDGGDEYTTAPQMILGCFSKIQGKHGQVSPGGEGNSVNSAGTYVQYSNRQSVKRSKEITLTERFTKMPHGTVMENRLCRNASDASISRSIPAKTYIMKLQSC